MQITNDLGLPESLYQVVCGVNSKYSSGDADITVTQLIDSPRIRILRRNHADEITEDVSNLIWRFLGHVGHSIIHDEGWESQLKEERFYKEVRGWKVGGQIDLYDSGKLTDFKVTSKYSVKNGMKEEWENQLQCYAYLLRENGYKVETLEIVAILRDAGRADKNVAVLDALPWHIDVMREYVEDRVMAHSGAEESIPVCTDKERWYQPPVFAVMRKGRKSAVKLFDNKNDAMAMVYSGQGTGDSAGSSYYLEWREGVNRRCENYCEVSGFCDWWQVKKKLSEPVQNW